MENYVNSSKMFVIRRKTCKLVKNTSVVYGATVQ